MWFPLTPTLSPSEGEREKRPPTFRATTARISTAETVTASQADNSSAIGPTVPPLPLRGGEGRGEGALRARRRFRFARPVAAALCLLALSILPPYTQAAESRQAPNLTPIVDPEKSGAELAARLRAAAPPEPTAFTGKLEVVTRDDDKGITVPIRSTITPGATNWVVVYQALEGAGCPGQRLAIIHTPNRPNVYTLDTEDPGGKPARTISIGTNELASPFSRSDFWFCDLGLEFLHWPKQRVLRHEMRRSRPCWVLESATPTPLPGGYARVLSWVDVEHDGILLAEAYDAGGKKVKEFKLGSFRKVDGRYELENMKMRNLRTGSESELKFDLKPERKGAGE